MFFFDTCNAVAAREDQKPKYWRLGCRHLGLSLTTYSRCRVWRCDVTTSNSIQDGGALVVSILVFDLRVQLTYQRKTLLFALIKVSTFICKKEIPGFSSPLKLFKQSLIIHEIKRKKSMFNECLYMWYTLTVLHKFLAVFSAQTRLIFKIDSPIKS